MGYRDNCIRQIKANKRLADCWYLPDRKDNAFRITKEELIQARLAYTGKITVILQDDLVDMAVTTNQNLGRKGWKGTSPSRKFGAIKGEVEE